MSEHRSFSTRRHDLSARRAGGLLAVALLIEMHSLAANQRPAQLDEALLDVGVVMAFRDPALERFTLLPGELRSRSHISPLGCSSTIRQRPVLCQQMPLGRRQGRDVQNLMHTRRLSQLAKRRGCRFGLALRA